MIVIIDGVLLYDCDYWWIWFDNDWLLGDWLMASPIIGLMNGKAHQTVMNNHSLIQHYWTNRQWGIYQQCTEMRQYNIMTIYDGLVLGTINCKPYKRIVNELLSSNSQTPTRMLPGIATTWLTLVKHGQTTLWTPCWQNLGRCDWILFLFLKRCRLKSGISKHHQRINSQKTCPNSLS